MTDYAERIMRNVPEELRKADRWLAWAAFDAPTKADPHHTTKIPISPVGSAQRPLETTDATRARWSLNTALSAVGRDAQSNQKRAQVCGVGFSLGDGFAGIDLDAHGGEPLNEDALSLCMASSAYIERSPNGGYHIVGRYNGDPVSLSKTSHNVEIYTHDRFFTVTGDAVRPCEALTDITELVRELFTRYAPRPSERAQSAERASSAQLPSVGVEAAIAVAEDAQVNQHIRTHVGEILAAIDPDNVQLPDYMAAQGRGAHEGWIYVGMCLHHVYGYEGFEYFDTWSQRGGKYDETETRRQWDYFERHGGRGSAGGSITGKTLLAIARANGYASVAEAPEGGKIHKPSLTIELLDAALRQRHDLCRYNQITARVEMAMRGRVMGVDRAATILYSDLHEGVRGCSIPVLEAFLTVIADNHAYNPVRDLIEASPWDGHDHLSDLFTILHLAEDDWLSRALIRKWFMQGVALQYNGDRGSFGADGILVLAGAQHIGKTSFFRCMAVREEWFLEGGSISRSDKDYERRMYTTWVAELGELESTFRKADVDELKNLITRANDQYRLPFGRSDIEAPRHAVWGATVNGDRYLRDETGNRRYWTVPLTKIDLPALRAMPAIQLWAQARALLGDDLQAYRLSEEELVALNKRNGVFDAEIDGETEIRDTLALMERNPAVTYQWQTLTRWLEDRGLSRRVNVRQAGKVFAKLKSSDGELPYPQKRTPTARLYRLPFLGCARPDDNFE